MSVAFSSPNPINLSGTPLSIHQAVATSGAVIEGMRLERDAGNAANGDGVSHTYRVTNSTGTMTEVGSVAGRWDTVNTDGRMRVDGLHGVDLSIGGTSRWRVNSSGYLLTTGTDLRLCLDGTTNTYLEASSANVLDLVASNQLGIRVRSATVEVWQTLLLVEAFNVASVNGSGTIGLSTTSGTQVNVDTTSVAGTVNLPSVGSSDDGQVVWVSDSVGNAPTNNITVNRADADTIDGGTSYVINNAYGSVGLVYDHGHTRWKRLFADGNVSGPASANDNAIPRFDLGSGKLLQASGWTITDGDALTLTDVTLTRPGANELLLTASARVRTSGELEIDGALNHDGTTVGFYGVAPVARSPAYTPTNVTTDRSYNANGTSTAELADVLGTLIADLQALGLIG